MTWRGTGAIVPARVQYCTHLQYCQMLQNVVETPSMDRAALCFPRSIHLQLALHFPLLLHPFDALCSSPSLACIPTRFCSLLMRLPGLRSLLLSTLSVTCCCHFPGVRGSFFECDDIVSWLYALWNIHRFHKQRENLDSDYEQNLWLKDLRVRATDTQRQIIFPPILAYIS